MSVGEVQATFCATVVDEWVRSGLSDAVLCPGSRSTPLALALAGRPEVRCHVRLDERGAGFFAVGLGLATGRPAPVVHHQRDGRRRAAPVGGGGPPRPGAVARLHGRPSALAPPRRRAADHRPDGAVRPGRALVLRTRSAVGVGRRHLAGPGRPGLGRGHLGTRRPRPRPPQPGLRRAALRRARPPPRGAARGRPSLRPAAGRHLVEAGEAAGWPARRGVVVAGARCGGPAAVLGPGRPPGLAGAGRPPLGLPDAPPLRGGAADLLARSDPLRRSLLPEVVLLLGDPWISKAVATMVAEASAAGGRGGGGRPLVALGRPRPGGDRDATGPTRPPGRRRWPGSWPARATAGWLEALAGGRAGGPARHRRGAGRARGAPHRAGRGPCAASRRCPTGATVVVAASSMPVRDLEWFAPPLRRPAAGAGQPRRQRDRRRRCHRPGRRCRRRAAGGRSSSGDLAFLHDVSSWCARPDRHLRRSGCTLVVVDNGGGGIFSFLPQADRVDRAVFERLFGTPQAADVAAVARGFGPRWWR